MIRVRLLVVPLALVLLVACTDNSEAASVSIPSDAVPVGRAALTEELAAVADLGPDDGLYQLPVRDDHWVFIRVRSGEPPLLFGTSCDLVSAVALPVGWQGVCLEYTSQGQRIFGQFPHGTVSKGGSGNRHGVTTTMPSSS